MLSVDARARGGGGGQAPSHPALGERSCSSCGAARKRSRARPSSSVLRDAGVVDAGGAGLLELVRGRRGGGHRRADPEAPPVEERLLDAIHQELSRYVLHRLPHRGQGPRPRGARAELEQLGDSLLVVGDESAIKVHVHTDDPGAALSSARARARSTASRSRTCTSRRTSVRRRSPPCPTCGARSPASSRSSRARATGCSPRAREASARSRSSRRPDEEPVDRGPAPRGAVARRGGRDHPAEQLEHRARRRARGRARRPRGRGRDADSIPAGLAAMVAFDGPACSARTRRRCARPPRRSRPAR